MLILKVFTSALIIDMNKLIILLLSLFLTSCYPRELWVKRDLWICVKITEGSYKGEQAYYVKWENEEGILVYEILTAKPTYKVGFQTENFIIR